MKHVSIALLIVMVSMASSAMSQEDGIAEEKKTSSFQPKPLDDEWSKWLIGKWEITGGGSEFLGDELEGVGESSAEVGAGYTIEFRLNGQFVIWENWAEAGGMTDAQKKQMKEQLRKALHLSDEELERFVSMPYRSLLIQTIDPKTGERIAYCFDSQRLYGQGRGRLEGNKEVMEWKWSGIGRGVTSVSIMEKIDENRLTISMTYTLPDGRKMEEEVEMTRKQETSESATGMASHAEDLAAVKQLAKDYRAAWLTDDPEALLALYADDAVLMLTNEPPLIGKEALRTLYQYVFENYTHTGSGKQLEVEVAGDLGYIWSTYTATSTPKAGGEPIKDRGNSVFIVRRQHDGSWKVARLIATRDVAPASSK